MAPRPLTGLQALCNLLIVAQVTAQYIGDMRLDVVPPPLGYT